MAGVLGKTGLQFESRGAARFKYVRLLQEQTARKEREPSDSIRGDNFGEGRDVDTIDVAFQQRRNRFDSFLDFAARGRRQG